jgi:nitrilase
MTDMITEHVKLPGGVTGVLERPGARLVYEVAGDGPAVVLIHGFGLDMRMWDPQIGPLAARFRVVRYDCRGFGASGPFDPGVPYTHAGDLVALLDHLGIGDAVLAGLSFGGRVALQAALAAPDRVRGLALLDAVLDGVPWDPESARALDEVTRRVQAGGVRAGREAWLAHPLFAAARERPDLAAALAAMVAGYPGQHWLGQDPHRETRRPIDVLEGIARTGPRRRGRAGRARLPRDVRRTGPAHPRCRLPRRRGRRPHGHHGAAGGHQRPADRFSPGGVVDPVKVAAVQAAPVLLDRDETIAKVVTLAGKAAAEGARLVAFPEAFVPGYPDWVWRTRPWDADATALYARLFDQAVVVGSPATDLLAETAARLGIWLSVGVDERDDRDSTIYNTLLHFAPDGTLAARHRKLMPTGGERLVWGTGDGSTLQVVDTGFGRLGGLICWENYMPLARAALYAQGIDVYLAPTWDNSEVWVPTLRHIAREGRTYVIGVTSCISAADLPADLPGRDSLYGDGGDWLSRGNTVIVGPEGRRTGGPADR